jgi:hypothetical protein
MTFTQSCLNDEVRLRVIQLGTEAIHIADHVVASRQRSGNLRRSQDQTNWMCFIGRDAFASEVACDETDRNGKTIVSINALRARFKTS